MSMITNMYWS